MQISARMNRKWVSPWRVDEKLIDAFSFEFYWDKKIRKRCKNIQEAFFACWDNKNQKAEIYDQKGKSSVNLQTERYRFAYRMDLIFSFRRSYIAISEGQARIPSAETVTIMNAFDGRNKKDPHTQWFDTHI